MINGRPAITWTPYGREQTVSVLAEYMKRDHERGLVDEWWLCLNTDTTGQEGDLRYAYSLARKHPWIKVKDRPAGYPRREPKQRNTGYFYLYMTDPLTTFIRVDDDIVYVHEEAFTRLARSAWERPETACSFPIMWNNSIISWFAQKSGIIPAPGEVTDSRFGEIYTWPEVGGPYCMDAVGWANGRFGAEIHDLLLTELESDAPNMERFFTYQDFPVQLGQQFSVSVFASQGSLYANLDTPGLLVPDEEENWHTVHRPRVTGQPNIIVGDALVSHFTFKPQQRIITRTDTLDRYRKLALSL